MKKSGVCDCLVLGGGLEYCPHLDFSDRGRPREVTCLFDGRVVNGSLFFVTSRWARKELFEGCQLSDGVICRL